MAEMVGTTRSRVSFFMNRFRKLGFIHYDVGDNVRVRSSLLNVVLHDDDGNTATPGGKNPKHRANKRSEPPPEPRVPLTKIAPEDRLCAARNDAVSERDIVERA